MFKIFFLTDKNMMIAIIINAMVISLLYFPSLHDCVPLVFLDVMFIIIFLIEAILKIFDKEYVKEHGNYFKDPWNVFDFIIVVLSLPTIFHGLFPHFDISSILILRLLRLTRLLRFMRFIPHIADIIAGLGRAIKASVFVIIVLFILNFILAIFSCHFYAKLAPEYFGNPLTASYSIFQMFTIEGWNEIPLEIGKKMESDFWIGLTKFFFVLVVLVGGIFGMSLANAIFVDEMTMDNNQNLEDKIDKLQAEIQQIKGLLEQKLN